MKTVALEIGRGQIIAISVTSKPDGTHDLQVAEVMPPRLNDQRLPKANFNEEHAIRTQEWLDYAATQKLLTTLPAVES